MFRSRSKKKPQSSDIRYFADLDEQRYQVLLIPVGFTAIEISDVVSDLAFDLGKQFSKIPVQFSYLAASVPVPINHIERLAFVERQQESRVVTELQTFSQADGIALVLNTTEYCGGKSEGYVAITGRHGEALQVACHELGHHFDLSDGEERYYSSIENEELFTSLSALPEQIRYAARRFNAPIYKTGNHFAGRAVYRFYQRSFMSDDSDHYQRLLAAEKPVFNDMQIHIMRAAAAEGVRKRLGSQQARQLYIPIVR